MDKKKEKKVFFFPVVYGGGYVSTSNYCRSIFIEIWIPKDGWNV